MKKCAYCSCEFTVDNADRNLLERLSVKIAGKAVEIPEPTFCDNCRQQRRLSFRNERGLYKRKSSLSGREIIGMYDCESPYVVYSPNEWWGDSWDQFSYGRDFNFNRTFFEQFSELMQSVPRLALNVVSNTNSDYVNLSGYNKNCYLIFAAEYNEDCQYGTQVIKSRSCFDALNCLESEFCYESVDIKKCNRVFFSQDVSNCFESMFLYNCRDCSYCLFSSNLRSKQYFIFNAPVTKAEFSLRRKELLGRLEREGIDGLRKEFTKLKRETPQRAASMTGCVNSSGNFLVNCKNAEICFDLAYGENCRYVFTGYQAKDLMDVCHTTEFELGYECMSVGYKSYNVFFASGAWSTRDAMYVDSVHSCSNIFGCSNLKNAQYCILNKKYSKDEYETLVPKIIAHMQETKEWGEYFPITISPFKYEDTIANDYFPVKKNVRKYEGSIPKDALICEVTGRPYQITQAEKEFYHTFGLPLPRRHPDQRHSERMALRPSRRLLTRECSSCSNQILTVFELSEVKEICCERCYLKSVY